ncbi:aldehyde oxidase GLOX-like [Iris pallida]|uniref:Aldehyde oxidase GLOX-like n=1 Tax=Iris pallida TaxID=29817 RepID=A0AAX6I567_IRIPA|nr:aldehyde oxidase GLOX-like [Iris pallida]
MYDVATGDTVQAYPDLEGGPWVYPCGGSSTLLPLTSADYTKAEILICGGSVFGVNLNQLADHPARATCGRIVATDPNPTWTTEDMPIARAMGDMIMLPTGNVVIINGAQTGSQGYERADNPALNPVLYSPDMPAGARFATLAATTVPRMYHSTANLLPDGRVLVAGSNPHFNYQFDVKYPTELSLEAYSPEYLDTDKAGARPSIEVAPASVAYGAQMDIEVTVGSALAGYVEVNFVSAPFATHSYSMGQRLVKLATGAPALLVDGSTKGGSYRYSIGCQAPLSGNVAPPGYYMVFVVNNGVPSVAAWIQLVT